MKLQLISALTVLIWAAPVTAKDADDCLPGLICASLPATVVQAVQDAGYKAKLVKDDGGDPMISSSASGYDYQIYFYGCEDHVRCDSIQFNISFTAEGYETPALSNEWNVGHRFGKAYIAKDGSFTVRHDVSTVGGMNKKNLADTIDWWAQILGEVGKFWDAHPNPKGKKKS